MPGELDEYGLTPKQRIFAEALAGNQEKKDAYMKAYDASRMKLDTIKKRAYEEAKKPKVKSAIDAIRKENSLYLKYDKEAHFRDLEELEKLAMLNMDQNGNRTGLQVAKGVVELKGKMCGHYTDKVDITSGGEKIQVNIVVGG